MRTAVLGDVTRMWGLSVGPAFSHAGETAWVAPARGAGGEDLVLKLGMRHTEAAHEADGLRVWQGDGAVRVLAVQEFDEITALLLERCRPGTELGRSLPEPEQDVIVAGLLRRLWRPAGDPFRPLSQLCDEWAAEFEQRLARRPGVLDPGLAREGMRLFRTLPRTAGTGVLLCTDLHGGNILSAEREPWLMIDPKPYIGDPCYDVLQHMLNCDRLVSEPAEFAIRMADLAGLDRERVALWQFARCVQESIGQPKLRAVAARIAPA